MESRFAANAENRGQNVRCIIRAQEVESRNSKKECLLLVSDTNFEQLYTKSANSIRSFSWFKLSKIECDKEALFIVFDKLRLNFVSDSMEKLYNSISDILPRILQSTELKSSEFVPSKSVSVHKNGLASLLRLQERSKVLNMHANSSTLSYYSRFVTFSETIANLSRLSSPIISIPIILDALSINPLVKEIVIPSISRIDSYKDICNFVAESSSVEHIEVEGAVTRNFDRYLNNIEGNKELNICGLTFTDSRMNSRNLEALSQTLIGKNIVSLGMKRAVASNAVDYFYDTFLGTAVGQKLVYLNLDKTLNPNVKFILEACPQLQMLSLANCGLDVSKVALLLTNKQAGGLRAINLSNNVCKSATPRSLHISATIQHIQIDSITWENRTLPEFFQTMTHSIKQGLYLSVADTNASTDEWIRLFSYFRQTKFTGLHSLVWASNPVHNRLFDFLAKNHDLVHLDLSGCFIQQEKESMQSFASHLAKLHNLKSLVIRGNSTSYVGDFLPDIISSVESAKNIRYLDVCGNKAGNAGISAIKELINGKSAIDVVSFDGNEPETADSLIDLLASCTSSLTGAAVSYPQSDVNMLVKKNKISQEVVEKLRYSLMYVVHQSPSPFDRPFHLFRDNPQTNFPSYIKGATETNNQYTDDNVSEMYTLDNIEVDQNEPKPKIHRTPIGEEPNESLEADDAEPPTLQTLTEGLKKRRRGSKKRKRRTPTKEEKLEATEETLESILPDNSATFNSSELGDIVTLENCSSEATNEPVTKDEGKKRHRHHHHESTVATSVTSAVDAEDGKKKKSRKRKHGSSSVKEECSFDWTVPVKYTFFVGMEKLWHHADLRYGLQTLVNDLHSMRPSKK